MYVARGAFCLLAKGLVILDIVSCIEVGSFERRPMLFSTSSNADRDKDVHVQCMQNFKL